MVNKIIENMLPTVVTVTLVFTQSKNIMLIFYDFYDWKKSCVEEPDIYIGENYSSEYQKTKKKTKDFLHSGTLQEPRQRLDSVFIS